MDARSNESESRRSMAGLRLQAVGVFLGFLVFVLLVYVAGMLSVGLLPMSFLASAGVLGLLAAACWVTGSTVRGGVKSSASHRGDEPRRGLKRSRRDSGLREHDVGQAGSRMAWSPFDFGKSLGSRGSEGGVIVLDDELDAGARITIERGGVIAPYAITCGVYGCMVHTRFFSTEAGAREQCEAKKPALAELVASLVAAGGAAAEDLCTRFVDRFP